MDFDQTSHELLAHFDRPNTVNCPDFEWEEDVEGVAGAERSDLLDALEGRLALPQPFVQTRGVRWVLQWAAALGVLMVAVSVLVEFAYLVAAERSLNLAARAGAREATLPRATYQSITSAIDRRLTCYPELTGQLHLSFLQNGVPVGRQFYASDGDCLSITLSAPTSSMVPGWLRRLSLWRGTAPIIARAESQVPGRKLRPAKS